jgi:tRNA(adenine34) deaminase
MVAAAVSVAEEGLAAGELPIGAVVFLGGEIAGRSFTREKTLRRRLVHADLLAMLEADQALGWRRRAHPLELAVNLEPCIMCLGAAMAMGVTKVHYGLESPADGAARIAAEWPAENPGLPGYLAPDMTGGVHREEARDQFRRYCRQAADSGLRRWAQTLADLPDTPMR